MAKGKRGTPDKGTNKNNLNAPRAGAAKRGAQKPAEASGTKKTGKKSATKEAPGTKKKSGKGQADTAPKHKVGQKKPPAISTPEEVQETKGARRKGKLAAVENEPKAGKKAGKKAPPAAKAGRGRAANVAPAANEAAPKKGGRFQKKSADAPAANEAAPKKSGRFQKKDASAGKADTAPKHKVGQKKPPAISTLEEVQETKAARRKGKLPTTENDGAADDTTEAAAGKKGGKKSGKKAPPAKGKKAGRAATKPAVDHVIDDVDLDEVELDDDATPAATASKKGGKKQPAGKKQAAGKKAGAASTESKTLAKGGKGKRGGKTTAAKEVSAKQADASARDKKQGAKSSKGRPVRTAAGADKYELYQKSVQVPEADLEFFEATFEELRGRKPMSLREDFCGTAFLAATWVGSDPQRTAVGVDLDPEPLAWGEKHVLSKLDDDQRERLDLHEANVLDGVGDETDIVCAMNFSYNVFHEREQLKSYFEVVYDKLAEDGVFFTELYGGTEAIIEIEEDRKVDGFTYIWEQETFNPLTNRTRCHIHFKFPDGTQLRPAFSYEWRLWGITELRDLLQEVGFSQVQVYWETVDEDGDGTGEFELTEEAEQQESWLVYIVAAK